MKEYQKQIENFLREHGADALEVRPAGKHQRLYFTFAGKRHDCILSTSSSDHRAAKNKIADLRRLLGPPIHQQSHQRRSLEDMTVEANGKIVGMGTSSVGMRAVAEEALRPITESAQAHLRVAVETGEPISLADAVVAHHDEKDGTIDLIFQAKRKVLARDGKRVLTSFEPIALVSVSAATLAAALAPFELFAPPPPAAQELAAPEPAQPLRKTYQTPRDIETIIELAKLIFTIRKEFAGADCKRLLGDAYKRHGIDTMMSANARADLYFLGTEIDAVVDWVKTQPKIKFSNASPSMVLRMWRDEKLLRERDKATPATVVKPPKLSKSPKKPEPPKTEAEQPHEDMVPA